MAPKSTVWMFGGFQRVFLVYLLVCGLMVSAADEGTVYLDQKEAYVRSIASSAETNQRTCGNLDGCKNVCTRAACYPLGGAKTSQCYQVDNNEYCGIDGGNTCKYMLLDYTQSFTTLPPPGDITKIQSEVARDICLQKGLEPTYKNASKSDSEYSLVYYGAVSGAWISFPGRESSCSTPFDTRKRPWYLDGISVKKEVKIIIDVGSTMSTQVSLDYGRPPEYTYLNLAKDTTLELLQTFSSQDYVEVISFDSRQQVSLGAPVNIMPYDSFVPSARPELAPLVAKVESLASSPEVAPSNLDAAIGKAASSFTSALTGDYLKVIIVLSNGLFAPLNSSATGFPSKALKDLKAKVMIYKLKQNQQDLFLTATPSLKDNLCSVNGSFELLEPQATLNPLYAMRSYFTYLARVHLAVVDKPNWSNKYQSYSQLHNISTVTYPVFGNDTLLIGVAGIDVPIEDLEANLRALVLQDLPNRSQGILSAPVTFPMTCDYQTADRVGICPNSNTSPVDVAVCKQTDLTSTLKQRTCCSSGEGSGTCAVPESDKAKGSDGKKIGIIIGSLIGATLLVGAIIIGWCWYKRVSGPADIPEEFPGDAK
ncbi:hypothetical protein KC19_7G135200 [Ceratodon purpureus]|uniref:VWFA domain-containing protein n=1 Tax=Ceratodon purpureus TaxID=3225 RepID=A0A8T0HBA1_CERPU|nr:hypothetical protein KC19_7G135200 [Ceratodon purpureus]